MRCSRRKQSAKLSKFSKSVLNLITSSKRKKLAATCEDYLSLSIYQKRNENPKRRKWQNGPNAKTTKTVQHWKNLLPIRPDRRTMLWYWRSDCESSSNADCQEYPRQQCTAPTAGRMPQPVPAKLTSENVENNWTWFLRNVNKIDPFTRTSRA